VSDSASGRVDCAEVLDQLYAFVDAEMSPGDWQRVRAHLEACSPCQANYQLECLVKALVARSCCEHAPAQLRERVLGEIRHRPSGPEGYGPTGLGGPGPIGPGALDLGL
jgi:mycothiol system anti-sigma-R factor